MPTAICMRDLRKTYGDVPALALWTAVRIVAAARRFRWEPRP